MSAITNVQIISIEEYIARFVDGEEEPSCEYLDGEIILKPMGTKQHSQVQANIIIPIRTKYGETLSPSPELSTRLRRDRFCIPDLAVEDLAKPIEGRYPMPESPALLCVEIVSPPDRVGKLFGKCEEYHRWGVPIVGLSIPRGR